MTLQKIENLKISELEFQNDWFDNPATFNVYMDHGFTMSRDVDETSPNLIKEWFEDRRY